MNARSLVTILLLSAVSTSVQAWSILPRFDVGYNVGISSGVVIAEVVDEYPQYVVAHEADGKGGLAEHSLKTDYSIEVIEELLAIDALVGKPHLTVSTLNADFQKLKENPINQFGDVVVDEGYIVSVSGWPLLEVGKQYLLFVNLVNKESSDDKQLLIFRHFEINQNMVKSDGSLCIDDAEVTLTVADDGTYIGVFPLALFKDFIRTTDVVIDSFKDEEKLEQYREYQEENQKPCEVTY